MMAKVGDPTRSEAAATGDDPLRALFVSHYASMVRVATALLGDAAAAEDVVQDAFVSVDRALAGVAEGARVAYLRQAVMNAARSRIRRTRAAKRQPVLVRTSVASSEDAAIRRDEQDVVLAALDRLPLRQRQCLVLRYYGELSDPEVADALGLSLGTAKTHLRRGLAALQDTLGALR